MARETGFNRDKIEGQHINGVVQCGQLTKLRFGIFEDRTDTDLHSVWKRMKKNSSLFKSLF
jgi:hypothetical protein